MLTPGDVDHVRLHELIQAVLAIGASDTALAPTGVEALHGFEVLAVDIGFAETNLPAGLECGVEVARVNGRGQPKVGIVGAGDGFVQVVEGPNRDHRAEYFLADNIHLLAATDEHRRLIEIAALAGTAAAAGGDGGAGRHRAANQRID